MESFYQGSPKDKRKVEIPGRKATLHELSLQGLQSILAYVTLDVLLLPGCDPHKKKEETKQGSSLLALASDLCEQSRCEVPQTGDMWSFLLATPVVLGDSARCFSAC